MDFLDLLTLIFGIGAGLVLGAAWEGHRRDMQAARRKQGLDW